jgi:flagellar biosynthetic protein FliP
MRRRHFIALAVASGALALSGSAAFAQLQELERVLPPGDASAATRIVTLAALITVLSIAPGLLVMVTSFTRIIVVLSFLRAGLGLQTTPPNIVLVSLALFLTFYVMSPTLDRAWKEGLEPWTRGELTEEEAFARTTEPFRQFMLEQTREKDLGLFVTLAPAGVAGDAETARRDLRVLIPAFMVSELRRAFEIGFLIVLPFLIIDLVVATLTMSMGMMMLPPTAVSLPFKILFFVLIDGWNLLVGSLVRSFG